MIDVGVCFEGYGIFTTVNYGASDVMTQGGKKGKLQ
jgi:hypothetical protein